MSDRKPADALCLCEYDDVEGQRQHLMATCCDCDAVDVAFDRFVRLYLSSRAYIICYTCNTQPVYLVELEQILVLILNHIRSTVD